MSDEPGSGTTCSAEASVTGPVSDGDFDVAHTWFGRTVVVTVSGDLDMLTAPALAEAIRSAARGRPAALIVDLSAVDFLASAGMNELVTAQDELAPTVRFGVVADGPATSRPLRIIGVDQLVALYPTLADALHGSA
jgi:anti-sigma B factor antagonist